MMTDVKKYQRCMVMAGGGFRFGYYLGIYAALCETGRAPDVLLASCGGAIAAGTIQAFPSNAERKAWLSSPAMYQFWLKLKSNEQASISRALLAAVKRRFFVKKAATIPDLFHDYLFEVPELLPWPEMPEVNSDLDVAIIAGKLLYNETEVGLPRGDRKLFAETLFCSERSAALLQGMSSPLSVDGDNAIAAPLLTDTAMPMAQAIRASVSDMYYFRCHSYQGQNYIGGVIDLFPIEVAKQLAEQVVMELKGPYDNFFSLPALRTVLGIDGNQRLRHVLQQSADLWVDTSDMTQALVENQIYKKILWRKNKIKLMMPPSYQDYLAMIDAQWQYGYQRGLSATAKPGRRP